MAEFDYQTLVDPSLLENPDDPAALGSSLDELYPFGIPEGDFADLPQADAPFKFNEFDFDQQTTQVAPVDYDLITPVTPQSTFPEDQRYVSLPPQPQTHPTSAWRPFEQPMQDFQYPDPEPFSLTPITPTPYYPLQPVSPAIATTQQNFRAITPPGQQFSSIDDRALFLPDNLGLPTTTACPFPYPPIPTYQDNTSFNAEDLALSPIPKDLLATAISEGWALPSNQVPLAARSYPDSLYLPNAFNCSSSSSDPDYTPPNTNNKNNKKPPTRRTRLSRPHTILPNGTAKKGRPCAKPQTEERQRVNKRRMEGYYRRKNEQGSLEKARQQSKESYWRRKQRRIEAGEKVRSYHSKAERRA